jgi:hypothetical protein
MLLAESIYHLVRISYDAVVGMKTIHLPGNLQGSFMRSMRAKRGKWLTRVKKNSMLARSKRIVKRD